MEIPVAIEYNQLMRQSRQLLAVCAGFLALQAGIAEKSLAHNTEDHPAAPLVESGFSENRIGILDLTERKYPILSKEIFDDEDTAELAKASPVPPYNSSAKTMPVTRELIEFFMPIALAESPNSDCSKPSPGKLHSYDIRILPPSDADDNPNNDMRTKLANGNIVIAPARYNETIGPCTIDFLDYTTADPQGIYAVCTYPPHESKHADKSLPGGKGYRPPEGEVDPTGLDKYHNYVNKDDLMSAPTLTQSYGPCLKIKRHLEAKIEQARQEQEIRAKDLIPKSVHSLAEEASSYIPRLKRAYEKGTLQCEDYKRHPKFPEYSRKLCFNGTSDFTARDAAIITIKSIFTNRGKPVFSSEKMPDYILRRYLLHGSLSTYLGKQAYIRSRKASAKANTPFRFR